MLRDVNFWLYRLKWHLSPYFTTDYPVHLDLELTSHCNLKCVICPHSEDKKDFPLHDMNLDMAINALREGAGKIKSVKLNWRGEPFLYKHIPEVILYAKRFGYVDIMVNTNGNVPFETIKDSIKNGLTSLSFSMDSPYKEEYEELRPNGKYELILNNIIKSCELSKNYPDLNIAVQCTSKDVSSEKLKDFMAILPYNRCQLSVDTPSPRLKSSQRPTNHNRKNCWMPWRRLVIGVDGSMYPCCSAGWGMSSLILGKYPFMSIYEAWNSKMIKDLRGKLYDAKNIFTALPVDCVNCYSKESYLK